MRAVSLLFHDVYRYSPDESGFPSEAAHRYKLSTAAFEAQLAGVAAVRSDAPVVAADLVRSADRPGLPYLITFDDGGVSYYTVVADRLEREGWRGHCFVTTDVIGTRGFMDAAQIRDLDARGHVIGSHSASHPRRFNALTAAGMREEWDRSRRVLEDVLGHAVDVASVPGGFFSRAVAREAAGAGIRTLFTSEPITTFDIVDGCRIAGRFTLRASDPADAARRLVMAPRWARSRAWLDWNAKGLVKPLLGDTYVHITHWLATRRAVGRGSAASADAS